MNNVVPLRCVYTADPSAPYQQFVAHRSHMAKAFRALLRTGMRPDDLETEIEVTTNILQQLKALSEMADAK
jgi:hypothetical protein